MQLYTRYAGLNFNHAPVTIFTTKKCAVVVVAKEKNKYMKKKEEGTRTRWGTTYNIFLQYVSTNGHGV